MKELQRQCNLVMQLCNWKQLVLQQVAGSRKHVFPALLPKVSPAVKRGVPGRKNTEALVPWADFLNHDCSCNCHIDYDAATSSVVMTPDRAYTRGQQV